MEQENVLKRKELGMRSIRRSLLNSWYDHAYADVEMSATGGRPRLLASSIEDIASRLFTDETRRTMQLKQDWPRVAGAQLAALTSFGSWEDGVLALEVRHSAFLRELRDLEPDIRLRVNTALGGDFCRQVRFEPAGSRKR